MKKTALELLSPEAPSLENRLVISDNKYCQFVTSDKIIIGQLKKFLSYKTVGVEYTAAYKNGWNGITYLLDTKGYFLLGLLPKVITFLSENNIPFTQIDKRKPITVNPSIDLTDKLKTLGLIPRDYQLEILDACIKNNRGIVRACTSSGKTLCAAMVTAHYNKPTIITVIGLDLLKQFHDLFSSIFDEPIGFIGNGVCEIQRINIASIWTIGRALKLDDKLILSDDEDGEDEQDLDLSQKEKIVKLLNNTKLIICDESHVVTTKTISEIYKNVDPDFIYGFSGTPFRDDGSDLLINGILGEQIINISASRLIENGIIATPIIKFVSVPQVGGMSMQPYQTVYKSCIVENDIRNNFIIQNLKSLIEKKYTPLILFKQIKHGSILFALAQDAGIKCEMLHGNDSLERRTDVKKMLVKKEIDCIFASVIFDIGIDIPMLSALVLTGSGKSTIRTLQRIGRVIRMFPGKKIAAIIDFYDQVKFLKKHSLIRYETYKSEAGFKVIKCKEMK